jgi:hypothetical protein
MARGDVNQPLARSASPDAARAAGAELAPREQIGAQPWRGMTLASLLRSSAAVKPAGLAFAEAGDPAARRDGGNACLDYRAVGLAMDGLRLRLSGLGAKAGDTVAIVMPNRAEALIAILCLLEAGIRPLLLPLAVPPDMLWAALAGTGASGLLVCADGPGAELSAGVVLAARAHRSLHFVAAFGERAMPGCEPLGGLHALQTLGPVSDPTDRRGTGATPVLTVEWLHGVRPITHTQEALIAAALHLGLAAGIVSGDPILTTLPAATQAGVATGLAAALVTGSPLHLLPVFSSSGLAFALAATGACHLVAPALLEQPLAAERLLGSSLLRATLFLHRAPADLTQPATPAGAASPVIDVLALGERATLAACRDLDGGPCLTVGTFGLDGLGQIEPVALLEADAAGTPTVSGPGIGRSLQDDPNAVQRIEGLTLHLRDDGAILGLTQSEPVMPAAPAASPARRDASFGS